MSIPHKKKIRPVIVIRVSIETALRVPSPVNCAGVVEVGLAVVLVVPPTDVPANVKFAQVIRVLLAKVDGDGAVSEEGAKARKGGGVVVNVVRSVVIANLAGVDLAVLSGEVTNLAGLGKRTVTGRCLETR